MPALSLFTAVDEYILLHVNYLVELLTTIARQHTAGISEPGLI